MYQIINASSVRRLDDGACIPADPDNTAYAAYLAWLAAGNVPQPADVPSLDQVQVAAVFAIDAEADAIRRGVLGARATEYQRAYDQATAFKAAAYSGPVPSSVQSWADAKAAAGWTVQQCCDDILATGDAWLAAQDAIRAARLLAKEQVRAAVDQAGVDAAMATWAAVADIIRGQLGAA